MKSLRKLMYDVSTGVAFIDCLEDLDNGSGKYFCTEIAFASVNANAHGFSVGNDGVVFAYR